MGPKAVHGNSLVRAIPKTFAAASTLLGWHLGSMHTPTGLLPKNLTFDPAKIPYRQPFGQFCRAFDLCFVP